MCWDVGRDYAYALGRNSKRLASNSSPVCKRRLRFGIIKKQLQALLDSARTNQIHRQYTCI